MPFKSLNLPDIVRARVHLQAVISNLVPFTSIFGPFVRYSKLFLSLQGISISVSYPAKMQKTHGFTLLELIITVGIIGVVTAIAVPSMGVYIKNDRLTTNINTLISHLALARSESVTRSLQIGLCASDDYTSCASGTSWASGWIVFVDSDGNGTYTAAEEILRVKQELNQNTLRNSAGNTIIYDDRGFAPNSSSTFSLCDDRLVEKLESLSISITGRVRKGGATTC